MKGTFVFVVCGAEEHIAALNYSLEALRKFSRSNIIVVTDRSRNAIAISHNQVVDVRTPDHLDHHQASIWLKTSLHRYLPEGPLYCYLDTDVVALSDKVDGIFEHYAAPITFARDHCRMDKFSPSAVNCGCIHQFAAWEKELKGLFKRYHHLEREEEDAGLKVRLEQLFIDIKKDRLSYTWLTVRFWLARKRFELNDEFVLHKDEGLWRNSAGRAVLYEREDSAIARIEASTDYRCDTSNGHLWTINGKEVFDCKCDHLRQQIETTFGTEVATADWHHWNGGVFLFDGRSHDFLDMWHDRTARIFGLPEWKTRDQGTLISTVWEMGLQDAPVLPSAFNLIADHAHDRIIHHGGLRFTLEEPNEKVSPHFIHVYHHWGDAQWDVWQAVEERTGISLHPERQIFNALWIGNRLSAVELLTINSHISQGHVFRLWAYEHLETPLPAGVLLADASEIIPKDEVFCYRKKNAFGHGKGSYAGFSDIFRYRLLYERGGWWTDMDITCLRPIFTDRPYFFRPHHDLPVVGNVMKCPAGSELMKMCYDQAMIEVNAENTDWLRPIRILNDNICELGLEGYISREVSNHDRWDITSRFIWKEDEIPEQWLFIHWQNEEWRTRNVNRADFYHRSALAKLMAKHGLFEIPESRWERTKNEWRNAEWSRRLEKTFL
ncbi:MAG: hypothetical protein K9J06_07365 [Flavobacteriales bacterium]|nr:hypothetical protein [Flavobacteriales bacterium]